ncbi:MAG: DUF6152 family protein [Burkholderiaceae bacterium]
MICILRPAFGAIAAALLATAAFAHHAWNEVDTTTTFTLTGTVKSLKWENPHSSLVLTVASDGATVDWTVQMSGLARMESHGIGRGDVAVGKVLTIVASPARDEAQVVRANHIRSDGKDHVLY